MIRKTKGKLKAPPIESTETSVAPEEDSELVALKKRQAFLLENLELHEKERWAVPSQLTVELGQLNKRIEVIETTN